MEQRVRNNKNSKNVIKFSAQKINNNRINKNIVSFMGKKYWMDNRKIEVYRIIGNLLTGVVMVIVPSKFSICYNSL